MNDNYINIYNNLVNLTRNKDLYKNFTKQDSFSDRLIFFLFHFAFFLKVFKKNNDKKTLQNIYDYLFKQLELSIREIGYGDQTINKKMKTYINLFYSIIDQIDNWEKTSDFEKKVILSNFLDNDADTVFLMNYFDKYMLNLTNNTLNSYIKGVVNN
jgi:cytochrome b pre-mRNA-processing protein 3